MVGLSLAAKMKLITHNMLSSQGMKGVKVGYPLKIEVSFYTIIIPSTQRNVISKRTYNLLRK